MVYCAIFIFFFLTLPLPHVKGNVYTFRSLAHDMNIDPSIFYWLVIILILAAVTLYFFSTHYPIRGSILLDTEQLTITDQNNQAQSFRLADLEAFRISRGSTVHKSDNGIFGPETSDNWISFTYQQVEYKYEFAIRNEEENRAFEKEVYELRSSVDGFVFTSI